MKIIEVARTQRDLLNEGIAFISIWREATKNGKFSWFSEDFHPIEVNDTDPVFEEEQLTRLAEIAAIDENAILLNGYYDSWVGSADEPLNATEIAEGIKRHYEIDNRRIKDYLAGEQDEDDETIDETTEPDTAEEPTETETDNLVTTGDWVAEEEPADCDTFTIELPWRSCGDLTRARENLQKLVEGKATLIKAALGEDGIGELPIEFTTEDTVRFKWLKLGTQAPNPADGKAVTFGTIGDWDSVRASWTEFFCHLIKFAKKSQRVTAKDGELDSNPKFSFRTFLVRIGMNGAEFKVVRKTLLRNLEGSTAFATAESAERWKSKHLQPKKEEVTSDEQV